MFEDIKLVTLLEYLAKADLGSDVAVILQVIGQLEDGTPVTIIMPDDVTQRVAEMVAERVSLPGSNPTITTVDLSDD